MMRAMKRQIFSQTRLKGNRVELKKSSNDRPTDRVDGEHGRVKTSSCHSNALQDSSRGNMVELKLQQARVLSMGNKVELKQ